MADGLKLITKGIPTPTRRIPTPDAVTLKQQKPQRISPFPKIAQHTTFKVGSIFSNPLSIPPAQPKTYKSDKGPFLFMTPQEYPLVVTNVIFVVELPDGKTDLFGYGWFKYKGKELTLDQAQKITAGTMLMFNCKAAGEKDWIKELIAKGMCRKLKIIK